ncbi:MAG TPA: DUF3418 domain-containing protein, partial [Polyangiaceae bacterium]
KADDLHRRFRDDRSDFLGLLRLWQFVREAEARGKGQLRRTCKENFLSFIRVREWGEIHRQLEDVVRDLRLDGASAQRAARSTPDGASAQRAARSTPDGASAQRAARSSAGENKGSAPDDALHLALLTGLLSKVGQYNAEARAYLGAKQTRFTIHPSSGLARKPPAWLMAFELVETSQVFARTAARIEPDMLLQAGAHLLKRSYSDPHWSEKSARASIREHATLFGLSVAKDRSVDYASVAPAEARKMFLDHALVRGEYRSKGAFQEKNRLLLAEVARLRDKARRSDMMANDDALLAVFDRKVPESVVNGKTFEAWREEAEGQDAGVLLLSMEDVLAGETGLAPRDYPDKLTLHGVAVPVTYRFDPSANDDGISLTIPLVLVPQLDPGELDWTIPGWHEEKIAALLHELPKANRRELGAIAELARRVASRLPPFDGALLPKLAEAIEDECGARVPVDAFRLDAVPAYLRLTCRLVDAERKVVAEGRDIDALWKEHGARARAAWKQSAPAPAGGERKGITRWDFGELAPFVVRRVSGMDVRSYPALVDRGSSVDLVLLESAAAAETATRAGVRRLLLIAARGDVSSMTPRLPGSFSSPGGAIPSRAASDAFRALVLARIVDDAFGLGPDAPLPRTPRAFEELVARGVPRLTGSFRLFTESIARAASELDRTLSALRSAQKHLGAKGAIAEIQGQLVRLFPDDLLATIPLARLDHYPRYLRAAQARLGRAIADPRKDSDKLAPLAPLWAAFLAKEPAARERDEVMALRWTFEELRVAIFAPELKTPVPVSVAKVAAALAALR